MKDKLWIHIMLNTANRCSANGRVYFFDTEQVPEQFEAGKQFLIDKLDADVHLATVFNADMTTVECKALYFIAEITQTQIEEKLSIGGHEITEPGVYAIVQDLVMRWLPEKTSRGHIVFQDTKRIEVTFAKATQDFAHFF